MISTKDTKKDTTLLTTEAFKEMATKDALKKYKKKKLTPKQLKEVETYAAFLEGMLGNLQYEFKADGSVIFTIGNTEKPGKYSLTEADKTITIIETKKIEDKEPTKAIYTYDYKDGNLYLIKDFTAMVLVKEN